MILPYNRPVPYSELKGVRMPKSIAPEVRFEGAWGEPGTLRLGGRREGYSVVLGPLTDEAHKAAFVVSRTTRTQAMKLLERRAALVMGSTTFRIELDELPRGEVRIVIRGPEVQSYIEAIGAALKGATSRARSTPFRGARTSNAIDGDRDRAVLEAITFLHPLVRYIMTGE